MRTFLMNALGVALVSGAVYAVLDGHDLAAISFAIPNMRETARELDEQLPILRQLGRVCVFVEDETGVAHMIAR